VTPSTTYQQSRVTGSPAHRPSEMPDATHRPSYLSLYFPFPTQTLPLLPHFSFCCQLTHGGDLLLGLRMPRLTYSVKSHPLTLSLVLFPHDLILSHHTTCSLLLFPHNVICLTSISHWVPYSLLLSFITLRTILTLYLLPTSTLTPQCSPIHYLGNCSHITGTEPYIPL
jgi:hypothetical protein